jgi:hypothetical protein
MNPLEDPGHMFCDGENCTHPYHKGIPMMNPEAEMMSDSLMRRIELLAKYVMVNHPGEFRLYWKEYYRGKATADEFLEFMSQDNLSDVFVLMRKVKM